MTKKMALEKLPEAATAASYTASGGLVVAGGLSLHDWGIIAGIVFACLTWVTSTIIGILRYRRERKGLK